MVPGHFMRKLQQGLFLDENREVTPLGKVQLLIGRSYLNYSINWLLVKSRRCIGGREIGPACKGAQCVNRRKGRTVPFTHLEPSRALMLKQWAS